MSIKTILVHFANEKRTPALIEAAATLARRFEAHLTGLYVVPQVFVPAVVPFEVTGEIIEIQRKAFEEAAQRIEQTFREAMQASGLTWDWRRADGRQETVENLVMLHGRAADLIVMSQSDQRSEIYAPTDVTEDVMMGAGRPVLVIPIEGKTNAIGVRVLVAWNGSKEAARATFDSLPLLKAAKEVRLLTVDTRPKHTGGVIVEGAEIARTLSRHGIRCVVETASASSASVAEQILAKAKGDDCDLLVMGGYGHSWLREVVFGGATRDMLAEMTIPVFMSH